MRYPQMIGQAPPSPPLSLKDITAGKMGAKLQKTRLPTSRHHCKRKASMSTTSSSMPSVQATTGGEVKRPTPLMLVPDVIHEVDFEDAPPRTPKAPIQIKEWESYLHWLALSAEPGTLWNAALCDVFQSCLAVQSTVTAADGALRIDDVYWSFYLPLDPLHAMMEDKILSGYLLQVWTMFIELGKRIPYDDPGQDKLVELLRELVHLPPMEVRTWDGNDAPWTDLPTLDDALVSAWDDLYDPEIQDSEPESHWLNYFSFLGRLVSTGVTPGWWEIPAMTLREVLAEDVTPTRLTRSKTMALAEFINQAGDSFFEWCMDTGIVNKDFPVIEPLMRLPVELNWYEARSASGLSEQ